MENRGIADHPPKKKPSTKKKNPPPKCIPKFTQNGEAYIDAQRKIQEFFSPYQKKNVGTTTGLDG
jgi:hypothetical protein